MAMVVLKSAKTILDKVEVYRIQIAAFTAIGRMQEAIAIGKQALVQLGVEFPSIPDEVTAGKAIQTIAHQLQGRQIEDLLDLPAMSDLQTQVTMELLADLGAPIFVAMPGLYPILSSKMVSLSIQFGNTAASAMGYVNHGLVLSAFLGDIDTGHSYGKLALILLDSLNSQKFQGRILFLFAAWIQHRKEAIRTTIPKLKYGLYSLHRSW